MNGGNIGNHCDTDNLMTKETPWGTRVTINRALEKRFDEACDRAVEKNARRKRKGKSTWVPKRSDSYVCRAIRGSTAWSRHAYGAACDWFNRPYPEPVDVWGNTNSPPRWWARCFTKLGFSWGGTWISRKDYPHIEWSTGYVPVFKNPTTDRIKITVYKVVTSPARAKRILERHREAGWKGGKKKARKGGGNG